MDGLTRGWVDQWCLLLPMLPMLPMLSMESPVRGTRLAMSRWRSTLNSTPGLEGGEERPVDIGLAMAQHPVSPIGDKTTLPVLRENRTSGQNQNVANWRHFIRRRSGTFAAGTCPMPLSIGLGSPCHWRISPPWLGVTFEAEPSPMSA